MSRKFETVEMDVVDVDTGETSRETLIVLPMDEPCESIEEFEQMLRELAEFADSLDG